MRKTERDKRLTEAMGLCWHDVIYPPSPEDTILVGKCIKCGKEYLFFDYTDFSTWEGFGKLWEWAQKQKWCNGFKRFVFDDRIDMASYQIMPDKYIHPDRFADAVDQFLQEREHAQNR